MSTQREVPATDTDPKSQQTVRADGGSTIKNVVQAVIHLVVSPWGLVVLAVGLVIALVSSTYVAIQPVMHPPTPAPTPTLTPTPMAFAPAARDESLIIVTDFEERGEVTDIDPAQYVFERLVAQAREGELDVRVERLRNVVDDNTARAVGEAYSATLVLWGWYDAVSVTPRIERIKTQPRFISSEEGQHLKLRLSDPAKVEVCVMVDLPGQATYLTLLTLGMAEYGDGNLDTARTYLANALAAIPDPAESVTNPGEAYFYRGNISVYKRDYAQALADFGQAIASSPGRAAAYYNRGIVYDHLGEYEKAVIEYTRAIELDPDDADAFYNRGLDYDRLHDNEHAVADYTRAIELDPGCAGAYANRANLYAREGDYERAMSDHHQAIALDPGNPAAYYDRALTYCEMDELRKALQDFDKVLELDPQDWQACANRAILHRELHQVEQAIADLERVIELAGDPEAKIWAEQQLDELRKAKEEARCPTC